MHQSAMFEKMLAFLREGVDNVDTLKTGRYPSVSSGFIVFLFCPSRAIKR